MRLSFYTIDDLRLGPNLWTENRFDTIQSALSHYRGLPGCTVKELGLTDGQNTLRLVRRVALFPDNEAQENICQGGFHPKDEIPQQAGINIFARQIPRS